MTGTPRSDQMVTCAAAADAEALLIEKKVLTPFTFLPTYAGSWTSKYGNNNVDAGWFVTCSASSAARVAAGISSAAASAIPMKAFLDHMRVPPFVLCARMSFTG